MSRPAPTLVAVALLAGLVAASSPTAALAAGAQPAGAHTVKIVDLPGPGGPFGYYGPDLFREQAAAQRFTVPADGDYRIARIGLWLMNNSDTEQHYVGVSLQTDALDEGGSDSMPSGHAIEEWVEPVATFGWTPVEQFFTSAHGRKLKAGHDYWVVAGSRAPALVDPVWVYARKGSAFGDQNSGGGWYPAAEQGALTLRVDAAPIK